MEQMSDKILDFQLVQVSEVANSPAMEKVGLEKCLHRLSSAGVTVQQQATASHPQIISFVRKENPQVEHQFDVWHFAKAVTKSGCLLSPVMETRNF